MSGLIPIIPQAIGQRTLPAVSARELHEKLGIKKPFTQWFSQYTEKGDWRNDNDFSVFNLEVKNPEGGGRPGIDAALSIQMAEHIAMMTRTSKGREIREYFREARDEAEHGRNRGLDNRPITSAQMFALQAQVNLDHERQLLELTATQEAQQTQLDTQAEQLTAIATRQPPPGRMDPLAWLRKYSKPYLTPSLLKIFRAACRRLERPTMWRPDHLDYPLPYHTEAALDQAYEESTRQIRFFEGTHDPGIPYQRQPRRQSR